MIEIINDKDTMKEFLSNNSEAFKEGLLRLYSFQTVEEKSGEHPDTRNGYGFNRYDSEVLTSIAVKYINNLVIENNELEEAKKRILKYAGQLIKTN